MAIKSKTRPPDGFDVTVRQTIGRVEFGAGTDDPHVAAFKMIGAYGNPGVFQFPMEDGRTCAVTVEFQEPPEGEDGYNPPM